MESKKISSYKDLVVWQKGIELVNDVYSITRKFPKEEMFGLTNQMRRASISIPANIAEGWGRKSTKNYIQFIRISIGSLFEMETMCIIAKNQNYIDERIYSTISANLEELGRMLNKLLQSLDKYTDQKH